MGFLDMDFLVGYSEQSVEKVNELVGVDEQL